MNCLTAFIVLMKLNNLISLKNHNPLKTIMRFQIKKRKSVEYRRTLKEIRVNKFNTQTVYQSDTHYLNFPLSKGKNKIKINLLPMSINRPTGSPKIREIQFKMFLLKGFTTITNMLPFHPSIPITNYYQMFN
jgi:hypothetical protein